MGINKSISSVAKAFGNPRLVLRALNSLSHKIVPRWDYSRHGCDLLAEDWDNLLILDGCRYDIFESENWIPGRLDRRYSKASSTVGFLLTNIHGTNLEDTVYVTANGQIHNYQDELNTNFYDIIPVYAEAWDDDIGTVPPVAVTEAAIDAVKEYPKKRLLIHYVQPHFPFIGGETTADKHRMNERTVQRSFWRRVFDGDVAMTRDEIWAAYTETLRYALKHVETAVESLPGKNVVTSDHGNMVGERGHPIPIREWGHPHELYYPELVEVPWLECEYDQRREIIAEPPRDRKFAADPSVVKERLADLGYH